MPVVTSRQVGVRPETIRTRLARFMPNRVSAGWTITWSAQTDRPDEIEADDELRAADHLGCYASAVAHALAQADVAPVKLRVTAESASTPDGTAQPITVEIRAHIPGPAVSQAIVESIARRADPNCPVWKGLAAEVGVKIIAVLDEPEAADAEPEAAPTTRPTPSSTPKTAAAIGAPRFKMRAPTLAVPAWLTPKMAIIMSGVSIFCAYNVAHVLLS